MLRGRKLGDHDLYSCVVAARDSARKWATHGGRGVPRAPRALTECQASYQHLVGQLAQLEAWTGQPGVAQMPAEDCERLLDRLDADRATLARLPELHRLSASLQAAGLGAFVAEMAAVVTCSLAKAPRVPPGRVVTCDSLATLWSESPTHRVTSMIKMPNG